MPPPDLNIHSYALFSRLNPAKYGHAPAVQHYAADIALLRADPDYLKMEDRAIDANQKLNDLEVQVMNVGRRRSSEESNDLVNREERAKNLRHSIPWAGI